MARKKGTQKYYAIAKGRQSGVIVNNWPECQQMVTGFPGAIYKSFTSKAAAQSFLQAPFQRVVPRVASTAPGAREVYVVADQRSPRSTYAPKPRLKSHPPTTKGWLSSVLLAECLRLGVTLPRTPFPGADVSIILDKSKKKMKSKNQITVISQRDLSQLILEVSKYRRVYGTNHHTARLLFWPDHPSKYLAALGSRQAPIISPLPPPTLTSAAGIMLPAVYTDGAATGTMTAGAGLFFQHVDLKVSLRIPGVLQTSQRAELTALYIAICLIPLLYSVYSSPTILTDSSYGISTLNVWGPGWKRTGRLQDKPTGSRRASSREVYVVESTSPRSSRSSSTATATSASAPASTPAPLKNLDIIRPLLEAWDHLRSTHPNVCLVHTPGHCGIPGNEVADQLAVEGKAKPANMLVWRGAIDGVVKGLKRDVQMLNDSKRNPFMQ
eukprot:gnl/Dysnectes_brevis/8413_a14922_309.p1 GENE.gnl/Dysnectes_brevis/8413_a14922_309~~gnl/Dysnectes_brevis/8413_a14922_309.p1  ORF type:complete len:439 (+),score=66.22 gnl/Dysnectes_brevis/8413_a14922_309:41-1357(+)